MKKAYEQPKIEVTEFRFSEHIATSPGCYWSGNDVYSYGFVGCNTELVHGSGWVNSNG